jgi:hypothetical protein
VLRTLWHRTQGRRSELLRGLRGILAACDSDNGLYGGGLRRFDRSGLFDRSAMMEKARTEENCGEQESDDDGERKIVELGQRREQGRPFELRLNEVVARPLDGASNSDGLGMDLWL